MNHTIVANSELNWLNSVKINQLLVKLNQEQYTVIILDTIDSTNTYVSNNLNSLKDKTCVTTECQTNGRGRGKKSWTMRAMNDLAVSILYFIPSDADVKLLPLVIAVALSRLFKQFGLAVKIKWPNDIYLVATKTVTPESKICGILVESGSMHQNHNQNRFVVIGIGIDNVLNMERNLLLAHLLNHVDNIINEYLVFGFRLIRQEWLDNCLHYNKTVSIYKDQELIDTGRHFDLTDDGFLVIKTINDELKQYDLSNFSLRL